MYIVDKYIFKINNVVTYHHRGSTCDPAGILILVLLTANTQSFYDNSHARDIHPCGATHMFHHSQWGATSINHQKYPSNITYVDKIRIGENNVKDTIQVMAM